mmetsp:Transcript_41656/g.97490  ORF Transcript_41656/g.97490 Transcript_41656/m.97490 type:complete len:211 (-) Transcript_41656:1059-1691(-)
MSLALQRLLEPADARPQHARLAKARQPSWHVHRREQQLGHVLAAAYGAQLQPHRQRRLVPGIWRVADRARRLRFKRRQRELVWQLEQRGGAVRGEDDQLVVVGARLAVPDHRRARQRARMRPDLLAQLVPPHVAQPLRVAAGGEQLDGARADDAADPHRHARRQVGHRQQSHLGDARAMRAVRANGGLPLQSMLTQRRLVEGRAGVGRTA